jgi:hypothetical protein
MEVLEEEELAAMRSHQEHFEQIRNAELVATQRMEAAECRKIEEKERRLAQVLIRLNDGSEHLGVRPPLPSCFHFTGACVIFTCLFQHKTTIFLFYRSGSG